MKSKLFFALAAATMFLSSCVVSHTALVTNNPVGEKTGVAKAKISPTADWSFKKAKEDGDICTIGIAETKMTQILIFPRISVTVTGE